MSGLETYSFGTGCRYFFKVAGNLFKSSRKAHLVLYFLGTIKTKARFRGLMFYIVPRRGLEPPRVSPHAPQAGQSTNFCTWANTRQVQMQLTDVRRLYSIFPLFSSAYVKVPILCYEDT